MRRTRQWAGNAELDISPYLGKTEKVNVTLPGYVIQRIDRYVREHSVKAARHFWRTRLWRSWCAPGGCDRHLPRCTQEPQQRHQRKRAAHQHHTEPAAVLVHAAGDGRAERATNEDAGHVQRIEAAAAVGVEA
jgi:ribosomal protein L39E